MSSFATTACSWCPTHINTARTIDAKGVKTSVGSTETFHCREHFKDIYLGRARLLNNDPTWGISLDGIASANDPAEEARTVKEDSTELSALQIAALDGVKGTARVLVPSPSTQA